MTPLSEFRAAVDDFMGWHPESPLDDDQRAAFDGLAYYPENPDLVQTVAVKRLPDDEPLILMETSTGDTRHYRRWGMVDFVVDGQTATLTIYSDPDGTEFFLPFKDATNGDDTYGAGRYLDNHRPGLRPIDDETVELDFNYAYNPNCAYSPAYSCPLPPHENWLKVPIRAGEKAFE